MSSGRGLSFVSRVLLLGGFDLAQSRPEVVTAHAIGGCCCIFVAVFFMSSYAAVVFGANWVMAVGPAVRAHVSRVLETTLVASSTAAGAGAAAAAAAAAVVFLARN